MKSATETIGGSTSWQQTLRFDRYGNRNFDEANTTFTGFEKLCASGTELCAELRKILNPSANASDNRLSASDDYVFDTSGNTTEDAHGRTFIYDAENKQVEVLDSLENVIGEYSYDGDGKRIKKHVPSTGEVTVFVYDAGAKFIGEYSTIAESQSPKVSYTTADHLGSPRILTDENGATISRRDFHPFGEEILTTHRHPDLGYTADNVPQKFTGYERDIEVNLDFAHSRYYAPKLGRFYSVDPESAGAMEDYPQSWNAYVYVGNNPLNVVDPDGEKWKVCDNQGNCTDISDAEANRTLFNRKNNHPEIIRKNGKIFDEDGNVAGTYVRTSYDDLSDEGNALIFGRNSIGEQGINKGKLVGALAAGSVAAGACIALCPAAATAAAAVVEGSNETGRKNLLE